MKLMQSFNAYLVRSFYEVWIFIFRITTMDRDLYVDTTVSIPVVNQRQRLLFSTLGWCRKEWNYATDAWLASTLRFRCPCTQWTCITHIKWRGGCARSVDLDIETCMSLFIVDISSDWFTMVLLTDFANPFNR